MSTILVIEDDALVRQNILDLLEAEGYRGLGAENGRAGLALAVQQLPELIICDVAMSGIDGYEVFELLSAQPATAVIPFIFLSARAERADVRRGMDLGADDYLTKPFTRRELLDSIATRLRRRRSPSSQPEAAGSSPPSGFVVRDAAMQALLTTIDRVAASPISVLILGETGVGKELLAEQVHRRSGRKGRFVPVNCAALTESLLESELFGHEKGAFTGADRSREGLFESAEGGTLFLDEAGELPASTQVKLLRVLEERRVTRVGGRTARNIDVRFVSATHRDLEAAVQAGRFREDLYYRLNGISLHVPPLRERAADLVQLAHDLVARYARQLERTAPLLSEPFLQALSGYSWPGNIRELRNSLERAVLLCDDGRLTPAHLPSKITELPAPRINPAPPAGDRRQQLLLEMEQVERERILTALAANGGNQTAAAEQLGISRRTLVTRLSQYELPRPRRKR